ncbi:putative fad dependent protein [Colletotrichum karsti]|uniref:Fad dependent protein n=1 Tax=Colletotrichum karsti TaxID=1095194 RepID=A0A9P6I0C6_9PEZI|nr:putative fad dependent protein [Colletotrichum karsti]KAF9873485.1 putative fad dependent protein [Colletotrichum karsti]
MTRFTKLSAAMPKVTIVGAGIVGMAVASMLSRFHEVTIVARDLPGDSPSHQWASPWAGAVFLGLDGSTAAEQKMQRDAFAFLWALADSNPESSVKRIEMIDLQEATTIDKIWYKDLMPGFRAMRPEELPQGVVCGMSYKTVVLTPTTFLPWLAQQLKDRGVVFMRQNIESLSDLKHLNHDVLVNSTGCGARFLHDVRDESVQEVRGQTILIKTDFDKILMRHGKAYTYVIPRLDGTAILGGIKQVNNTDTAIDLDIRDDILRRVHENAPSVFRDNKIENVEIIRDNVGFRPARTGGVRVEKENLDGQSVVHAYGTGGGGYVFSFGVARAAGTLVNDFVFTTSRARL